VSIMKSETFVPDELSSFLRIHLYLAFKARLTLRCLLKT